MTADERREVFAPYQVDADLMAKTPNAHFLHCLPARRGEEVTADVIDGPQLRGLASGREPDAYGARSHALADRRRRLNRGSE